MYSVQYSHCTAGHQPTRAGSHGKIQTLKPEHLVFVELLQYYYFNNCHGLTAKSLFIQHDRADSILFIERRPIPSLFSSFGNAILFSHVYKIYGKLKYYELHF